MKMYSCPNANKSNGFTLVELLLVVALLAISIGVTSDILLSLLRSFNKTQVANEIEQQANFVSLKLDKELRNAERAELNGDNLVITNADNVEIEYELDLADSVLYRNYGGGGAISLTYSGLGGVAVVCPGSCFTILATNPTIVDYSFVFSQAQTTPDKSFAGSVKVENTIVIRNTY